MKRAGDLATLSFREMRATSYGHCSTLTVSCWRWTVFRLSKLDIHPHVMLRSPTIHGRVSLHPDGRCSRSKLFNKATREHPSRKQTATLPQSKQCANSTAEALAVHNIDVRQHRTHAACRHTRGCLSSPKEQRHNESWRVTLFLFPVWSRHLEEELSRP